MNVETNAGKPEGHRNGAQHGEDGAESDAQLAPDQLDLEIKIVTLNDTSYILLFYCILLTQMSV